MKPSWRKTGSTLTMMVILILGLFAFGINKCNQSKDSNRNRELTTQEGDWRHHKIIYSKHARCRMECRGISENEVEFVLANGVINEVKSKEEDSESEGSCPSYALEGNTSDGQHVRIVFGACERITKVITAIDLDVEHECDCR